MSIKELILDLKNRQDYQLATIGLDSGRLVQNETHLYFIIERFGDWEIVEQCLLSNIEKVEVVENFIGSSTVIFTNSSSWTCKDLPEDVDLNKWLGTATLDTLVHPDTSMPNEAVVDTSETFATNDNSAQDVVLSQNENEVSEEDDQVETTVLKLPNEAASTTGPTLNSLETQEDQDVEMIRNILQTRPDLQDKVHQLYGDDVDVLSDDVIKNIIRDHPQLVLLLRKMSGMSNPLNSELFPVAGAALDKVVNGDFTPFRKVLKGVIYFFVAIFLLQFIGVGCFVAIALLSGT